MADLSRYLFNLSSASGVALLAVIQKYTTLLIISYSAFNSSGALLYTRQLYMAHCNFHVFYYDPNRSYRTMMYEHTFFNILQRQPSDEIPCMVVTRNPSALRVSVVFSGSSILANVLQQSCIQQLYCVFILFGTRLDKWLDSLVNGQYCRIGRSGLGLPLICSSLLENWCRYFNDSNHFRVRFRFGKCSYSRIIVWLRSTRFQIPLGPLPASNRAVSRLPRPLNSSTISLAPLPFLFQALIPFLLLNILPSLASDGTSFPNPQPLLLRLIPYIVHHPNLLILPPTPATLRSCNLCKGPRCSIWFFIPSSLRCPYNVLRLNGISTTVSNILAQPEGVEAHSGAGYIGSEQLYNFAAGRGVYTGLWTIIAEDSWSGFEGIS